MQVRTVQELGAAVRQARSERGMTQAELAAQLGVARDWVVRLEQGHPRLEAQLVLDALDAAGVALTLGTQNDATHEDTEQVWDDLFADLTVNPPTGRTENATDDAPDADKGQGQETGDG